MEILRLHIPDEGIIRLLGKIIGSFSSTAPGVGLPLGNLTSQLLVNIYMNEFDRFVKHALRAKYYVRYADDFVIMSANKMWLGVVLPEIGSFLWGKLKLRLHPEKVSITTFSSGVDFLGWVHFPDHRVLRAATKRRFLRKMIGSPRPETVNSYHGLLKHGNTWNLLNNTPGMIIVDLLCNLNSRKT